MHIHFHRNNGWSFTFTTSHRFQDTPRPATGSIIDRYWRRRFTVKFDSHSKACSCSRDASNFLQIAKPASFLPTVPQYQYAYQRNYGHLNPKGLSRTQLTEADYNPNDDLPPPHLGFSIPELPENTMQVPEFVPEMADTSIITKPYTYNIPEQTHELEAPIPQNFCRQSVYGATPKNSPLPLQCGGSLTRTHNTLRNSMYQNLSPMATPAHPSNYNIDPILQASPSMTVGGDSNGSSPVPPYTPDSTVGSNVLHRIDPHFSEDVFSPSERQKPVMDQYTGFNRGYYPMSGYALDPAVPILGNETDAFHATNNHYSGDQSDEWTSTSTSPPSYQIDFLYRGPCPDPVTDVYSLPCHMTKDPRLGTWELRSEDGIWYREDDTRLEMLHENLIAQPLHYMPGNEIYPPRPNPSMGDYHATQPPSAATNLNQTAYYLPLSCNSCGTKFSGKYRKGNLTRHIREKHTGSGSVTGKICRECGKTFQRGDAARKHEWEIHSLQVARPNKRRS